MSNWLLQKLNETEKDYPNPKYAFNSTVNWMRALKIICEEQIGEESINDFYKKITNTNTNQEYVNKAIASIFSSLNYLQTLKSLMVHENNNIRNSINSHIAVVSWYYCIYNSAKAIISMFNCSYQDNHSSTAKAFHELVENRSLIMPPFDFFISDITAKKVDEQISSYRGILAKGMSLPSDFYPKTKNNALDCIFAYLKGTADYVEWQESERLRGSKVFKENGLTNFRSNKAKSLRDNELSKKKINFLTQAFRYRGKANYRDCIYFNDNYQDYRINTYIGDLEVVAQKFFMMSSFYISKRIERKEWQAFLNSLNPESKSYFIN